MRKLFFGLICLLLCSNAFSAELVADKVIVLEKPIIETQDYWVYVNLEDKSGVTAEDDAGRSKYGDVVAVLPVTSQYIPSATEKKEWMIYKTSLTDAKRQEMLEPMTEDTGEVDEYSKPILKTIAYRKNKLDTSKLGVTVKKGLVAETIDTVKIEYDVKTVADLSKYEIKRHIYLAKRPFIKAYKQFSNYLVKPAYAFSTTTCSDNDTEDREQICTINKTGEDYNTISLWESAKDGDLVTDKQIRTAEIYDDDGDLVGELTIAGSTTSADYYMKVTAPVGERHDGTLGSGVTIDANSTTNGIIVDDNYVVIEWLIVENAAYNKYCIYSGGDTSLTVRNCIIYQGSNKGLLAVSNTSVYFYNNIVYDNNASVDQCIQVYNVSTGNIYNNTMYNCKKGYSGNKGANVKNNIAIGNTTDFEFGTATHDYNVSEDATADGANSLTTGSDSDFVSVTGGSEDLHLALGAVAIDEGDDLGSTYETDIDGDTRSGTWDIGADEYISLSTFTPKVMIF